MTNREQWLAESGEWACSEAEYHDCHTRWGKSMLDDVRRSPSRAHALYVAHTIEREPATAAMLLGSLTHLAVLDLPTYLDNFFVAPALAPDGERWNRAKKDHKAAWQAVLDENAGKAEITADDNRLILAMRSAIGRNPFAARLLFDDAKPTEQAIFWTDGDTGLQLKARFDKPTELGIIADLKTTDDVSPGGFARTAARFGYHRQAAHYCHGYKTVYGQPAEMLFVCVSKEPPHDVAVYQLDEAAIELGRAQIREAIDTVAECMFRRDWTAEHQKQITTLSLPKYAFYESEYSL